MFFAILIRSPDGAVIGLSLKANSAKEALQIALARYPKSQGYEVELIPSTAN
jgi:hypothetical protein